MNYNKSTDTKRLLIYLFLAFFLAWIPTLIGIFLSIKYSSKIQDFILSYAMLCPSIAMLLTRLITKQGYKQMGFALKLKGNLKYYLLSIFVPFLYTELGFVFYYLLIRGSADFSFPALCGISPNIRWLLPVSALINAILYSFGALGEEAGWRGYMHPLLEKKFGVSGGVIIGGILWGIWHWPFLITGHAFGTDYPLFPFSGFLVFTAFTTATACFLWWLTKHTNSVWPATICHACNNAITSATILAGALSDSDNALHKVNAPLCGLIRFIPLFILGTVMFLFLRKKK